MRGRDLISRNLRRVRVRQGVSQERLAFDSGVDRSYLGGVERGEENPTIDVLDRLASTLAVPLRELFEDCDPESEQPAGLRRGRKPRALQA